VEFGTDLSQVNEQPIASLHTRFNEVENSCRPLAKDWPRTVVQLTAKRWFFVAF
jgi:hypothetical protein